MQTSLDITGEAVTQAYSIERLCSDNLDGLARLHEAVYGSRPAEDYYPRKYDTAYTGVSHVGYLAYNNERIPVAYYGVIPCFIQSGSEIVLAAQSTDTMTHPGYRYKGMFVQLSKMTFELCRELDIRFVFGFPNQNSYHGAVNKLGWKLIVQMVYFVIPVKTLPLESICQKIPGLYRLYKKYRQWLLSRYSPPGLAVASSVIADGFAGVYRSDEYTGYKGYSKTTVIQIGTVNYWLSHKPGLLPGDIEGLNAQNFEKSMKALKRLAGKLGVTQIQFHCSPGTSLCRLFETRYTALPSYPALYQDFGSEVSPGDVRFCFADIDIF